MNKGRNNKLLINKTKNMTKECKCGEKCSCGCGCNSGKECKCGPNCPCGCGCKE